MAQRSFKKEVEPLRLPTGEELRVHFETSTSEATAAAMLAASVRCQHGDAVTRKSTVGTNVASRALANRAPLSSLPNRATHPAVQTLRLVNTTELMHPRLDEVCAPRPAALANKSNEALRRELALNLKAA